MAGLVCVGKLRGRPLDVPGSGYLYLGGIVELSVEVKAKSTARRSRFEDTRGQTIAAAVALEEICLGMVVEDFTDCNLALALAGSVQSLALAPVQNASRAATVRLGEWIDLGRPCLACAFATRDAQTLQPGADYDVDLDAGMVRPLAGGALGEGDEIEIVFSAAAATGGRIEAGPAVGSAWSLRFSGRNAVDGSRLILEADRARLRPRAGLDMLRSGFNRVELAAALETLPGQTSPLRITRLDPND